MGAGNEWINGYLEAILDVGSSKGKSGLNLKLKNQKKKKNLEDDDDDGFEKKSTTSTYEVKPFNPTNYFVEEVVNSFDESDLYHTWIKVIATKNTRERNNRLENMCWRIWHLTRRKKQIALENTHGRRLSKRNYLEGKCGIIHDASEDLSDLSEGEKEKGGVGNPVPSSSDNNNKIPRINSDMKIWSEDDDKPKRLYIVLISVHGLVRGENMELGRDSDTGGQVKYVVELARALANMSGVYRVDLLTRQITSSELNSSYGEPIEMLSCPSDATDSCGAYIIRIPCGPLHKYILKESLWPYIPEFIDGSLSHIVNMSRALGEQIQGTGKPTWPYVIHGHYADSGEVAAYLSGVLNVPMVLTGHSLGRNKLEQLLKQGRLTSEVINSTYKITRRIEAEELGLDAAEMVVTSTRQEIEEQWGLYDGFDFKLERKLRVRRRRSVSCLGRYMPRMVVIPPGMDFSYVTNQDTIEGDGDLKSLIGSDRGTQTKRTIPQIWSEVMRFFTNPHKPMILALSRPDPKKNVTTLLKAYGECPPLRELANLTLILGNREDIEEMIESSSVVLTNVLKLIDKYDLYGQVAYPKHHNQSEVPEIYRLAAKTKGVFINPALVEPFGLTLIEAAAYALPIIATKNGGPVDIIKALNNGLLVDPHDHKAIAEALLKLVSEKNLWFDCRKNGLKNIHRFSWPEHCRNYLSHVEHCRNRHLNTRLEITQIQEEEPMSDSLKDVDDLSLKFSIDSDIDSLTRQKELIEAFTHRTAKAISYCPGRRQSLFIVAADCYDREGCCTEMLAMVIKNLKEAAAILGLNNIGLILLTGLTLQEVKEEVRLEDFDAVICSNGSEMCYPWKEDCSSTITADVEYEAHIEYRWPGENVKSIITRLGGAEDNEIVENPKAFSSRCFSYCIKPGSKTTRIDELRKRLRKRGLRCNPIYTRAASRLNVIPLLASRIQALRYLSVKWGIELSSMVVFTGDKGDTDYKDVLEGLHKTVILPGITEYGSGLLLCSTGESCMKEEDEGTSCISLVKAQTHEVNDIITALKILRFI